MFVVEGGVDVCNCDVGSDGSDRESPVGSGGADADVATVWLKQEVPRVKSRADDEVPRF